MHDKFCHKSGDVLLISSLNNRSGERTEIAIKEVKPCIDRLRREEDLRRERDIMMRVSFDFNRAY